MTLDTRRQRTGNPAATDRLADAHDDVPMTSKNRSFYSLTSVTSCSNPAQIHSVYWAHGGRQFTQLLTQVKTDMNKQNIIVLRFVKGKKKNKSIILISYLTWTQNIAWTWTVHMTYLSEPHVGLKSLKWNFRLPSLKWCQTDPNYRSATTKLIMQYVFFPLS